MSNINDYVRPNREDNARIEQAESRAGHERRHDRHQDQHREELRRDRAGAQGDVEHNQLRQATRVEEGADHTRIAE